MGKASDNVFPKIIHAMQTVDQSAPSDASWKVYAKAGGIYARSSNAIVGPFGSGSGSAVANGDRKSITAGDYTGLGSTTFADIDGTNLSITLTTGARRVLIGWSITGTLSDVPQSVCIDVTVDGTRLGQTFGLQAVDVNHATKAVNLSSTWLTAALTAASHTFKLQYRVTGSTNATFYASTGVTPLGFYVIEQQF